MSGGPGREHSDDGFKHIEIRRLTSAVGAEIHGVDLSKDVGDAVFNEIRTAFERYSVIFFRDQTLPPEAHIALAERFSEIDINRFFPTVSGYPQIAEVRKEPEDTQNIGSVWHADHTYDHEPAMGSLLYAEEVPPYGGDTLFASMYKAYEALSSGMRDMLDQMVAVHSAEHAFGPNADAGEGRTGKFKLSKSANAEVEHPVIILHPETGRRALYVNRGFTQRFKDMTVAESQPLLEFLYNHLSKPEFCCRFRWEKGSMAFWDNRCVQHAALNDYHGFRRVMRRITVKGKPLYGVAGARHGIHTPAIAAE